MLNFKSTAVMVALFSGSFIAFAAVSGVDEAPARDVLPAVQFVGHDSKIAEPRFVLARDEAAWAKIWAEHTGVAAGQGPPTRHAVPKVDFSRYMVVGAFAGAGVNADGLIAESVRVAGDAMRVRFETSSFQTFSAGPGKDTGVKTSCYGLWVIEKTDKPIVIERGVQQLKNAPVQWKEVKRFDAK